MSGGLPDVDGYTDLRPLGRGGFATVYRARQVAFDRDVALKVLDGAAVDGQSMDMFARECRAVGNLSWHPHIVTVHDAGRTVGGAPYIAMELLPGGSLADAMESQGALDPVVALRHVAEVADALAAAHEEGVLHRDIKPANVLIDRRGASRLADFGIARVIDGTSATTTGSVMGTIAYIAPEVLGGGKASPASDVYGLALTLVTLLSGANPFAVATDETPFAVVARVMTGEPVLPDALPDTIRPLVTGCLAREPGARPPLAPDLVEALSECAASLPDPSGPPRASAADDRAAEARRRGIAVPADVPSEPPPLVGPVTRAARRVPPPPESAVRARPDHTLAFPPPPPDGVDADVVEGVGTVEYELGDWPWGLERRLWERLEDEGIAFTRTDGELAVSERDEEMVDRLVDEQLDAWADLQDTRRPLPRRWLKSFRRSAQRLRDSPSDDVLRHEVLVDCDALDQEGAQPGWSDGQWRLLTLRAAELGFAIDEGSDDATVVDLVSQLLTAFDEGAL